jgi:hypothetical protein
MGVIINGAAAVNYGRIPSDQVGGSIRPGQHGAGYILLGTAGKRNRSSSQNHSIPMETALNHKIPIHQKETATLGHPSQLNKSGIGIDIDYIMGRTAHSTLLRGSNSRGPPGHTGHGGSGHAISIVGICLKLINQPCYIDIDRGILTYWLRYAIDEGISVPYHIFHAESSIYITGAALILSLNVCRSPLESSLISGINSRRDIELCIGGFNLK